MNKTEETGINDGGGIYDSAGFIDTIIMDCNNSVKQLTGGNYIGFCNGMAEIVKKLAVLKKGIEEEGKGVERDAAGSVHNTLDGALGGREERLSDLIFAEGGGLEPDPGHAGA